MYFWKELGGLKKLTHENHGTKLKKNFLSGCKKEHKRKKNKVGVSNKIFQT